LLTTIIKEVQVVAVVLEVLHILGQLKIQMEIHHIILTQVDLMAATVALDRQELRERTVNNKDIIIIKNNNL